MDKIKKYLKIAGGAIAGLVVVAIAIIAVMLWLFFGVLMPYYNVPNDTKAVADYNPAMALVSQQTYDALQASEKADKLELGINEAGQVVFKHPQKAFGRAKKEYKAVWKYGDKELEMKHLSRTYYIDYSKEDFAAKFIEANPDLANDAAVYAEILEIYSHSHNKVR